MARLSSPSSGWSDPPAEELSSSPDPMDTVSTSSTHSHPSSSNEENLGGHVDFQSDVDNFASHFQAASPQAHLMWTAFHFGVNPGRLAGFGVVPGMNYAPLVQPSMMPSQNLSGSIDTIPAFPYQESSPSAAEQRGTNGLHVSRPVHARSSSSGTGDTALSCAQCPARFTGEYAKGNMARHFRHKHKIEGRARVLPCGEASCRKRFYRQDAKLKHERAHHSGLGRQAPQRRPKSIGKRGVSAFCNPSGTHV